MKRGANLETLRSNGRKMAVIQRQRALDKYYQNPNLCKSCNKVIDVKDNEKVSFVKRKTFCNHSCAAIYKNEHDANFGKPHVNAGRHIKWSEEKKRFWKEHWKNNPRKRKNPEYTLEARKILSERCKAFNKTYWTEDRKKAHSILMQSVVKENPESYTKNNVSGRAKLYDVLDSSGKTKVKGTWELQVANYLNANKIKWTNKIEPYSYIWNHSEHLYYPDFLLLDFNILIEVKGFETDRDKLKWDAVKDRRLIIIREQELLDLSTLLSDFCGLNGKSNR